MLGTITTWRMKHQIWLLLLNPGGGHSTFFQVGVCGPDFWSVGLANWHLPLKRGACERKISKFGGLWAENFQIWGLVSWKFPNLEACELKFGWKLRLLRLKFPNFLKRGSCELTLLLEMGPLRAAGEAWKGGLQGRTSPYPLSRSVPPRAIKMSLVWSTSNSKIALSQKDFGLFLFFVFLIHNEWSSTLLII